MGNSNCKDCTCINQTSMFRKSCINKVDETVQQKQIKIEQIQVANINELNGEYKQQTKIKSKLDKHTSSNTRDMSGIDKGIQDTDNSFLPLQSKLQYVVDQGNQQDIQHVPNNPEQLSSIVQPLSVPFSVIKLLIKRQILAQLIQYDKKFQAQLEDPTDQTYRTWKMQKQGYYTNKKSDGISIIITDNFFYKGWTKISAFVPQDAGVLISSNGIFDGSFVNGKAHGKGTFIGSKGKQKYTGTWQNGTFVKGKIQGNNYRYDGPLKNNKPHGFGNLTFFVNNEQCKYIGDFINGKFQGKGQYQASDHIYIGNFKDGKKQGEGTLQKTDIKKSRGKGEKSVKFKGIWSEDHLQSIKDNE